MPDLGLPQPVESGVILEWGGLLSAIPQGYLLCDGTNGTPNLLGKFIRGCPAAIEPGGTGGEDSHILTTSEIPSHTHSFSDVPHTHVSNLFDGTQNDGAGQIRDSVGSPPGGVQTSASSASVSINTTGLGGAHNNKPAYRELAYIMKT